MRDFGIRMEHIGMHVENLDETIRWYHDVFGFELVVPSFEKWYNFTGGTFPRTCTMRLGTMEIEIYELQNPLPYNLVIHDYVTGLRHMSFEVEDVEGWVEHVKSLGIEIFVDNDYGSRNSHTVYVIDCNGMMVEVTNVKVKKPLFEGREEYYKAKPQHSAVDGCYKVTLTTDTNDEYGQVLNHYGVMKLYYEDDQLKGSMLPAFLAMNAAFRGGKVDGNKFSFTVHFSTPAHQYSMDVEGEVNGDTITGKATNPMGSCTITGTRVAENEVGFWGFNGSHFKK